MSKFTVEPIVKYFVCAGCGNEFIAGKNDYEEIILPPELYEANVLHITHCPVCGREYKTRPQYNDPEFLERICEG